MSYSSKNPRFSSAILTDQGATAVTAPKSGSYKTINRNGTLFLVDSSGNEVPVGNGAGEPNVFQSPSTAQGWTASASGVTVATSTTSSDLPLQGIFPTCLKVTPVSSTDYAYYRFTLPASLASRKLKLEWFQRALSGYTGGDLKVDVYVNAASNYGGAYTRVALSTDSSAVSAIPNYSGKFTTTFDTDATNLYYEVRIVRTAGTTACNFANIVCGPGIQAQSAALSASLTYTPTFSAGFGTVSATSVYHQRRGDCLNIIGTTTAGTVASSAATMTMPNGWTALATQVCGRWTRVNSSATTRKSGVLFSTASSNTIGFGSDDYTTAAGPTTSANGSALFSNSDVIYVEVWELPIAEFIGSGTLNIAQNDAEYAFNTATANGGDTTSFGYGSGGNTIPSVTQSLTNATQAYRVRFLTPIQATDRVVFEYQNNGTGPWLELQAEANNIVPFSYNGGNYLGLFLAYVNATDIDVKFGTSGASLTGGYASGTAGNYTTWATLNGAGSKWRLKKVGGGQAVGFGKATDGSLGLVNTYVDYTTVSTFTFNGSGGTTASITMRAQRIGDYVTVHIPACTGTSGTSSTALIANTALPTWARPLTASQYQSVPDMKNNNADVATPGLVSVNTSGIVAFNRDAAATAWTNSSTCGSAGGFLFSYFVGTGS